MTRPAQAPFRWPMQPGFSSYQMSIAHVFQVMGKKNMSRSSERARWIHDISALFGCLMLPGLGDRAESLKVTDIQPQILARTGRGIDCATAHRDHYPERQVEMEITCKSSSSGKMTSWIPSFFSTSCRNHDTVQSDWLVNAVLSINEVRSDIRQIFSVCHVLSAPANILIPHLIVDGNVWCFGAAALIFGGDADRTCGTTSNLFGYYPVLSLVARQSVTSHRNEMDIQLSIGRLVAVVRISTIEHLHAYIFRSGHVTFGRDYCHSTG
jgi:hypothetical protein